MRLMQPRASIGLAIALVSHGVGAAQPPASARLRVAVALDAAPPAVMRRATAIVDESDAIWRPHGVSVVLASSSGSGTDDVRLTLAFESRGEPETAARLRRRAAIGGGEGLGAIWFNEDGQPGQVIIVDLDAVAARIRQAGIHGRDLDAWPPALAGLVTARAVGRVLAHEIGHYLLASPAHDREGLMRAAFDGRQLVDADRRSFALGRQFLPRLRGRLARLKE